jgi:hypothetical protein
MASVMQELGGYTSGIKYPLKMQFKNGCVEIEYSEDGPGYRITAKDLIADILMYYDHSTRSPKKDGMSIIGGEINFVQTFAGNAAFVEPYDRRDSADVDFPRPKSGTTVAINTPACADCNDQCVKDDNVLCKKHALPIVLGLGVKDKFRLYEGR